MHPQPNDGFAWAQAAGGPVLVCRALELVAAHLFTTREWRLGFAPVQQREEAWDEVAAASGIEPARLVRVRQVHGSTVAVRRARPSRQPGPDVRAANEADIIVSDDAETALAVQTADCVPLLLADRRTGVVAAAHAGWRGIAAHVPQVAVEALVREFGSQPADLVAAIGPSIGACCYEVGADVRDAFSSGEFERDLPSWFFETPQPTPANPSMQRLTNTRRAQHWFFDGWAATRDQLGRAGLPDDQIHVAGLCTASHASLCSYRRDGVMSGRMAATIQPRLPIGTVS